METFPRAPASQPIPLSPCPGKGAATDTPVRFVPHRTHLRGRSLAFRLRTVSPPRLAQGRRAALGRAPRGGAGGPDLELLGTEPLPAPGSVAKAPERPRPLPLFPASRKGILRLMEAGQRPRVRFHSGRTIHVGRLKLRNLAR